MQQTEGYRQGTASQASSEESRSWVTWPQRQLRSQGPERGWLGSGNLFPQHAVYQQRECQLLCPTEQHRAHSHRIQNSPAPVIPSSLSDQVPSGKGHTPTSQMKTWRCRRWQGNLCPWVGVGVLPSPAACSLVHGAAQQAAPASLSPDPERRGCGLASLAKGLLLRGDRAVQLILLCSQAHPRLCSAGVGPSSCPSSSR